MKIDFNCEIVRTHEDEWYLDDDTHVWENKSAVELQGYLASKITEIFVRCEKERMMGSLWVDIHFQEYKPLKK